MAMMPSPFELTITLADNSGAQTTRQYGILEDDYDVAWGLADDWVATYMAATDCALVSWGVNRKLVNDALTLPAIAVQLENQAIFSGKILGDPTDSGFFTVPYLKPGLYIATSGPDADKVDFGETAVTNLVGLFLDGGVLTISDGEQLATPVTGKRRHTKNSNG